MIGAVKGYDVEIVMSEAVSIERQQMIKAFGASVTLTEGKLGTDGAIIKAKDLVKEDPDRYFMADQFTNEYNKIAHYRTTGEEIWMDTGGELNYFVSSLGTSGTIMGVGRVLRENEPGIKIVCAHPVKGHYIQGLKNMDEAIVPSIYDPTKIDVTIMVETEVAFEMSRQIVKREGIFVGMSSGAAMYAASEMAKQCRERHDSRHFPRQRREVPEHEAVSGLTSVSGCRFVLATFAIEMPGLYSGYRYVSSFVR